MSAPCARAWPSCRRFASCSDLGQRWRAGGRFVFYTGNPELALEEGTGQRLPPFHDGSLELGGERPEPGVDVKDLSELALLATAQLIGAKQPRRAPRDSDGQAKAGMTTGAPQERGRIRDDSQRAPFDANPNPSPTLPTYGGTSSPQLG